MACSTLIDKAHFDVIFVTSIVPAAAPSTQIFKNLTRMGNFRCIEYRHNKSSAHQSQYNDSWKHCGSHPNIWTKVLFWIPKWVIIVASFSSSLIFLPTCAAYLWRMRILRKFNSTRLRHHWRKTWVQFILKKRNLLVYNMSCLTKSLCWNTLCYNNILCHKDEWMNDAPPSHCWRSGAPRMLHAGPWVRVHNFHLGYLFVSLDFKPYVTPEVSRVVFINVACSLNFFPNRSFFLQISRFLFTISRIIIISVFVGVQHSDRKKKICSVWFWDLSIWGYPHSGGSRKVFPVTKWICCGSKDRFRSCDLWVMGPPRFLCATLLCSVSSYSTFIPTGSSRCLKLVFFSCFLPGHKQWHSKCYYYESMCVVWQLFMTRVC